MSPINRITLRHLSLPLAKPYRLSYRTFHEFEPYLIEVEDGDGNVGSGDGHISPGSSSETRHGGWSFLLERLPALRGMEAPEARQLLLHDFAQSKVAVTAAVTALDALERSPVLVPSRDAELPLLTPIGATDRDGVAEEVEKAIREGFGTFKVKVGTDVDSDLERLGWIQGAAAGRARLRVDANRAYTAKDAIRFATSLNPASIELFEQPCDADDWEANAAVAAISRVPLMLDEPICTVADIQRAAMIPGVAYCKVKLKRFGGLDRLLDAIHCIRRLNMTPVLGDGLGSELHSWMEACVASECIDNAGGIQRIPEAGLASLRGSDAVFRRIDPVARRLPARDRPGPP